MQNKQKSILFLIESMSEGGAQHMLYELIKSLNKTAFQPILVCYGQKSGSALEAMAEKEFSVEYLDHVGVITPRALSTIFRKIKEINPDVVHAHLGGMVFAIPWAALKKNSRLVVTAHTKPSRAFNKKVEPLLRWLLKHRKNTTSVVAVSKENHQQLMEYLRVSEDACPCINNGIDIHRFYQEAHDSFTYINVARQDENKNQQAIINAFGRIHGKYPNTKLILAGDGPCHQQLKDLVYRMDLEQCVSFPGMVGDVEHYYAVADVYVQSSYVEAMPLSVLEAMAAGLPIVSTNVGGLCDVVKENGRLVVAGDEEALYSAMRELYELPPEKRAQMGDKSREIVQGYSSENMARQYEMVYLRLTAEKEYM